MWTRSFQEVGKKNDEALHTILERDAFQPPADEPYSQELGDFYAACMDETAIDARGARDLQKIIGVIDTSDAEHAAATVAYLHLLGVPTLFVLEPEADLTDSRKTNAVVRQPPLPLSPEQYYGTSEVPASRDAYRDHIRRMSVLANDLHVDGRAVVAIELQLATAFEPRAVFHDPSGAPAIFDETQLLRIAPDFPWKTYFSALGIDAPSAAHLATPHYLAAFNTFFASQMKTAVGRDALQDLFRWQLLHALAPTLGSALAREHFEFESSLSGALQIAPRWKRCLRATESVMGDALAISFVHQHVTDDAIARASVIASSTQRAMQEELASLSWMDDATRAIAKNKIAQLDIEIGKAPSTPNYAGFKPDRTSFIGDLVRARTMATHRNLARIGKRADDTMRMSAASANAFFDPRKNQMVVLAGILASPFVDEGSVAKNDATLGMILGHEMTHAIDGRFDASGNLTHWWSEKTLGDYRVRSTCVQDRLDRALAPSQTLFRSAQAIDERMADGGGLRVAYRALERDQPVSSAEIKTRDQAFFTGFAQLWCAKFRPEALRNYAALDAHPRPNLRVNLAVSELPEFAAAFSCAAGDTMTTASSCNAW